jgi:D-xylose transport system substrate-binding protein
MRKRLIAMATVTVLAFAACSSPGPGGSGGTGGSAAAGGCLVGVSWNNYTQERWAKADEPNMQKAITAGGGTYSRKDARDDNTQQLTDIDSLIAEGAKVLIILAKDAEAIKPAIEKAKTAKIPVISYDRLIEDPYTFYITFDNKRVGTVMAEVIKGLVPSGNYAIIKGDPGDANTEFLRSGMTEAGIPAMGATAGGIKVVFEQTTANWDTTGARTNMEAALAANNNDIDAVLSENDGMATGVVAALGAQGMNIPVSGQDGDKAALNRVALGTQAVSVWKNANALGQAAGDIATQLCKGTANKDVKAPTGLPADAAPADLAVKDFVTPKNNTVSSLILNPTPITKDNLKAVVDAGWVTQADVCAGVTAGSVAPC